MTKQKNKLYPLHILYAGDSNWELIQKTFTPIKPWHLSRLGDKSNPNLKITDPIIVISDQDHQRYPDWLNDYDIPSEQMVAEIVLVSQAQTAPYNFEQHTDFLSPPFSSWQLLQSVHRLMSIIYMERQVDQLQTQQKHHTKELSELNQIGVALSSERDQDVLLEMILTKAREITAADAGSLYLIEKNRDVPENPKDFWADKQLRFKLAHNDSIAASYREFVMPVQKKSMAGYTALTGKPLNIPDAYHIDTNQEFQHNRSFDEKMGYRTQSVLCLPMKSHRGDIIGVLQLINRKKTLDPLPLDPEEIQNKVIPFDVRCVELASSLAGQAAVSIENMQLYEEIKGLFEGFILASVHAIEQRDPTTSGHSQRVAEYTLGLAAQVDRLDTGMFRTIRFNRDDFQQIKYAALLHDFGKIGVRENILVKAKKLHPEQLDTIKFRFEYIKKDLELLYSKKKFKSLQSNGKPSDKFIQSLEQEMNEKLEEIDNYYSFIKEANEPRVLVEGGYEMLHKIAQWTFPENGFTKSLLTNDEVKLLSIAKGSLSEKEREEIESHVTHTYNFLKRIPWSSNLKRVPEIAYAHHEKLDGFGYPRKLDSKEIPFPSKMMTIADIYDALTAWDRPYKKAVPIEKALDILAMEVKEGKIDPDLFKIFLDAEIFRIVKRPDHLD